MDISDKTVAILVDDYFEQAEFEEPMQALKDAGATVVVISTGKKNLTSLNHVEKGDSFSADLQIKSASSDDYDGLVIPGGAINVDALRMNEDAQAWADDFLDSGRPIAIICHAPWLLVSSDSVNGRRLTSFSTIQDDIINAGGDWVDKPLVIDANLITSRKPDDLPLFNDALIRLLSKNQPIVSDEADVNDHLVVNDVNRRPSDRTERTIEATARLRALGYSQKDILSARDKREILLDEDYDDPEQLHLSMVDIYDNSGDH